MVELLNAAAPKRETRKLDGKSRRDRGGGSSFAARYMTASSRLMILPCPLLHPSPLLLGMSSRFSNASSVQTYDASKYYSMYYPTRILRGQADHLFF